MFDQFAAKFKGARDGGVAVLAMTLVFAVPTTSDAKELIFNTYVNKFNPVYRGTVTPLSNRIAKFSDGALTAKVPSASLAPPPRQWSIVETGVADIAIVGNYTQRQRLALPKLAELPMMTKTSAAASTALWATHEKFFAPLNEYKGVKLLSLFSLSGAHLMNRTRPIKTVGDLQGLKIWTTPGALKFTVSKLGATALAAPITKVFELTSKGAVDGVAMSPGTVGSFKLAKFVKHHTVVPGGLGNITFSVIMNLETWKSLTESERAAVEKAAAGMPAISGKAMDFGDARGRKIMADAGVESLVGDAAFVADLRKRLAHRNVQWIDAAKKKGLANPEEAMAFYTETMQNYGK